VTERPSVRVGLALLGLIASACGGGTEITTVSGPTALRCQAIVSAPPSALPADGARFTVAVEAARECGWTASSDTSWIQVSPAEGQGASELVVVAAANEQSSARTASLIVNDQRVTLRQEAPPCRFALDRSELRIGGSGGRAAVELRTASNCSWTASAGEFWLRVLRTSGSGSATVEVEAQPNGGDLRSARIEVAGQTLTVTQERRPPAPAPAPTPAPAPPPAPAPVPAPVPVAPAPPAPVVLPPALSNPLPGHDNDDEDGDDEDDDDDDGKGKGKRKGGGG
jgi:hypothetical protein